MRKYPIYLNNPNGIARSNEPVEVALLFEEGINEEKLTLLDNEETAIPFQIYDAVYKENLLEKGTLLFIANIQSLTETYYLVEEDISMNSTIATEGIIEKDTTQEDGFKRLDTGYYELELCFGKANGTSAGKWGIRFFENIQERKNLIKDCSNAIGGFYGPFFTPKNGLINPPEHTKVDIITEVVGNLYHRYRFKGKIPNGIDENLNNKKFEIIWEFYYGSPVFRRKYLVDDFETYVDGMVVKNKITVGDEFESGQGNVVFNKFAAYGDTFYRQGDLYANILSDNVREILRKDIPTDHPELLKYKKAIGLNINEVSWDYFWKMFCSEENLLTQEEIREHVDKIIPTAHQITHQGIRNQQVLKERSIEVNDAPEQTIFPMGANKTCEYSDETGYSMVWYTDTMINRYQIVQRKDSGWVNWGTNGENEYPELTTGTTIKTAYGKFENWEDIADMLEKPIMASFSIIAEEVEGNLCMEPLKQVELSLSVPLETNL